MENKLCCLLKPTYECIGCELKACMDHSHSFSDPKRGTTIKCTYASYKRNWSFDEKGHAWGPIEEMPSYRKGGK